MRRSTASHARPFKTVEGRAGGHHDRVQRCARCGGTGLTEKTIYETGTDEKGNQILVTRQVISPCNHCGGTGQIG